MNQSGFEPSTSPQHPREVMEGFRGIQRNALTMPLKGRLAAIRAALDNEKRNRVFFRTSEGFQAAYSVKITSTGCVHTISAKSKKLPLDDQIEAVLFILLELNRQFGQAGIEMLQLSAGNIRRSLFGTLFVEFSLQPSQHQRLVSILDSLPHLGYTTQFIGTRKGFDRTSKPLRDEKGKPLPVTRQYSNDIGEVLAEVTGTSASYTLKGDEIYVRARIDSSKLKVNPYTKGEYERAWTQPWIPNR